jgi:hypothetical protein
MPTSSRLPNTMDEYRRFGHAFLAGSRFAPNTTVYAVATTVGRRKIQDLFESESAALTALNYPPPQDAGFSEEEANARVVYQLVVPGPGRLSEWDPIGHPLTYLFRCSRDSVSPPSGAKLADVVSVQVQVTWANDTTTTYTLPKHCDAVFLTRGAVELFAHPAYSAAYGVDYASGMLEELYGEEEAS